jgi:hypothetical protein
MTRPRAEARGPGMTRRQVVAGRATSRFQAAAAGPGMTRPQAVAGGLGTTRRQVVTAGWGMTRPRVVLAGRGLTRRRAAGAAAASLRRIVARRATTRSRAGMGDSPTARRPRRQLNVARAGAGSAGPAGAPGPAGTGDRPMVGGQVPERSAAGRPATPRLSRRCRRSRPAGRAAWTGTPPTPERLTGTLSPSTTQERPTGE